EKGEVKELALITQNMPYGSHFGTYALNTFQERMSKNNYRLSMFPVRDTEIASLSLPMGFNKEKTAGIICLELFDPEYIEMLNTLDIPLLFLDTAADIDMTRINADFLDRKSTRLNSSHVSISYAVFCLKKKKKKNKRIEDVRNYRINTTYAHRDVRRTY